MGRSKTIAAIALPLFIAVGPAIGQATNTRQPSTVRGNAKNVSDVLTARTFEAKPDAPEWVKELVAKLPALREDRIVELLPAIRKAEQAVKATDDALAQVKRRPIRMVQTNGPFAPMGRKTDAADVEAKGREVKAAQLKLDQAESDLDAVRATVREIQLDQQSGLLGPLTSDFGSVGIFVNGTVREVISESVVLMTCEGFEVMLRKFPTTGMVDGKRLTLKAPVRIVGTEKYTPRTGTPRTIYTAEPVDLSPYLNVKEVKVTAKSLDAEVETMLTNVEADAKADAVGRRTGLSPRVR